MEEKLICDKCDRFVEPNFLFCPYCGEPVSSLSKEMRSRQDAVAQLRLLLLLINKVQDQHTLKILEELIDKYKANLN